MKQLKQLPPIGLRIIKSVFAVFFCLVLGELRGDQGIPFYMVLSALWNIQTDLDSSKTMGLQRLLGTVIGAIYGLLILLFQLYVWPVHEEMAGYVISSLMIIPVIYTTVLMKKEGAAYYSCVVFLGITVTHMSNPDPFLFVWNRTLDTALGLAVGLVVNMVHIPHRHRRDILFVSNLDRTLLGEDERLSPYSRVELNRMLDHGMKFTISTARTPASMRQPLQDIHLNLPVIAMDGAVLYDRREKSYLHTYVISPGMTKELSEYLHRKQFHFFTNVIMEDLLIIYYQDFQNPVEEVMYQSKRKSPLRNYVRQPVPEDAAAVYLLVLDETEKIEALYQELEADGYTEKLKITRTVSASFPAHTYMRFFSSNATVPNMIAYLMQMTDADSVVTIGSGEGCDVQVPEGEPNQAVRTLKKMYEPFVWKS